MEQLLQRNGRLPNVNNQARQRSQKKRRTLLAGPAVDDSDTDSEDDAPAAKKKKTAAAEPEMYDGVTSVGIGSILSAPARGKRISGCCLFDPLGGHC